MGGAPSYGGAPRLAELCTLTMIPYIVRAGDLLTRLAAERGFEVDDAWSHPRNRALRDGGRHPDLLAPGDILWLPEPSGAGPAVEQGTNNKYKARRPVVAVSLVFRHGDTALANEPWVLLGAGPDRQGATDDHGRMSVEVPLRVRTFEVVLPRRRLRYPVQVGGLDPVAVDSGVRQRLAHLGFYGHGGTAAGGDAWIDDETAHRNALESFQRSRGLPVTGDADDATRQALVEMHGS